MKFLVTGGCGFIGSHLCDALIERNHEVVILDDLSTGVVDYLPQSAELVLGDVADPGIVQAAMRDVDGCFHLAAVDSVERSRLDWCGTHRVNQQGTVNVLNAARLGRAKPVPVVYASSAAVYGDNATVPLDESSTPRPISAYGADKLGSEMHARVAWINHQVATVGLRFFNVYGPRQSPASPYSGVISIFIDRIKQGLPLTIYGDGSQTRDFIYVADAVNHLIAAMFSHRPEASVYNVCSGQPTSIIQLAKTLAVISGAETDIEYAAARSGDIAISLGGAHKMKKRFDLGQVVPLSEGLQATMMALEGEIA
ncbi:NAD-dependent epimerase/dehydratase family protein [Neptunomonas sp. XY-337]|uniref:NAD-dependent epimerase/dehydratase family protein n=1 Tax=Neptunomonas sp. XY-337 TaxID=2561897 RepID=UPI0010AB14B6|nr:NAD-dependent epimerase/dehydratase family protein [Neptunomonas sp. XY-337]